MRPAQKTNRARGRGNRKGGGGGGNNINRVYDSAGPEGKVRGTPQQIVDKYLSLARDAQTSGDRVMAENFLQHAEHYQRILLQATGAYEERRDSGDGDDEVPGIGQPHGGNGQSQGNGGGGGGRPQHDAQASDGPDADDGQDGGRRRRGRRGGDRDGDQQGSENGLAVNGHDDTRRSAAESPDPLGGSMATIDTSDESEPDLLVPTEESRPRPTRRRRPAAPSSASSSDDDSSDKD